MVRSTERRPPSGPLFRKGASSLRKTVGPPELGFRSDPQRLRYRPLPPLRVVRLP